jgi:hypothetical protein
MKTFAVVARLAKTAGGNPGVTIERAHERDPREISAAGVGRGVTLQQTASSRQNPIFRTFVAHAPSLEGQRFGI